MMSNLFFAGAAAGSATSTELSANRRIHRNVETSGVVWMDMVLEYISCRLCASLLTFRDCAARSRCAMLQERNGQARDCFSSGNTQTVLYPRGSDGGRRRVSRSPAFIRRTSV